MEEKINCTVYDGQGGHALVFTVDGTKQQVGEIRLTGDDRYLLVMAHLFSQWANQMRGKPCLPASVHNILINGKKHRAGN